MISVEEARNIILSMAVPTEAVRQDLRTAVGQYLASPVLSPHPLPLFDNSAMDGYALRHTDTSQAGEQRPVSLRLCGSIPAGQTIPAAVQPGTAVQIFTGAQIPAGADAVIRQEDVSLQNGSIVISRNVKLRENIRFRGEEISVNTRLLDAGCKVTPAAVGLVTAAGTAEVQVHMPLRIALLTTGSEVISLEEELSAGKIFNSNGPTLAAAIASTHAELTIQKHTIDDPDHIYDAIQEALGQCDLVIVTGGVSVGEHDYVKNAAARAGVEMHLWRVKQKPGKPLFFGTLGSKGFFGLPGNPASALVCFYEYVYPYILKRMGSITPSLLATRARLQTPIEKSSSLTFFQKGCLYADGTVQILERQGSHMMSSFAVANCIVVVPEDAQRLQKGDEVEVHLLPQ